MSSSKCLHAHLYSKPYHENKKFKLNYHFIVGKLNYAAQTLQANIIYAVYELARFSANPREKHGVAMMYLCMYIKVLNVTLMLILPVLIFATFLQWILVQPNCIQVGMYSMLDAPSSGLPSYTHW